VRYLLSIEF